MATGLCEGFNHLWVDMAKSRVSSESSDDLREARNAGGDSGLLAAVSLILLGRFQTVKAASDPGTRRGARTVGAGSIISNGHDASRVLTVTSPRQSKALDECESLPRC